MSFVVFWYHCLLVTTLQPVLLLVFFACFFKDMSYGFLFGLLIAYFVSVLGLFKGPLRGFDVLLWVFDCGKSR